jgi:DNA-binding MarR family transcriptional regulator
MSSKTMLEPVAQQFGYVLKRAQQSLRARMDLELRAHELTTPQYAVLSAVTVSPGISNADLAKAAFVTPQTMQGIIATLEKRGLLERSADPDHGRRLMAQLTANGRRAKKAADAAIKRIEAMMMSSIPSREVERATETLLTCIENLADN